MMDKRHAIIYAVILVNFTIAGAWVVFRRPTVPPPKALAVQADQVLDPALPTVGSSTARYTLIEFGDYQCPPCAAAFAQVETVTQRYAGKMKFQFREYPLVNIHRYALKAALIAETARLKGNFWSAHRQLYGLKGSLDDTSLAGFECVDNRANRKLIEKDVAVGALIKLDHTPTFILCLPGGKVMQLSSVDQVSDYLR